MTKLLKMTSKKRFFNSYCSYSNLITFDDNIYILKKKRTKVFKFK